MDDPWKALKDSPVYESDDDIVIKKKEKLTKLKETRTEKKKRLDEQKPVDPLLVLAGMVHVDDDNEMMKMGTPVQTMPEPIKDEVVNTEVKAAPEKKQVSPTIEEDDVIMNEIKKHYVKIEDTGNEFFVCNIGTVNGKYETIGLVTASIAIPYGVINEFSEKVKQGAPASEIDDAREKVLELLISKAKADNANGLIGLTYQMTDLMGEAIEVLCMATAIKLK